MMKPPSLFVCYMTAIEPSERPRHVALIQELFNAAQSVDEIADGYVFRFRNETDVLLRCADFIAKERRCCPFFGFELAVEPEGGPVWLRLTGQDGVKPFIIAEIGAALADEVAVAAGFR